MGNFICLGVVTPSLRSGNSISLRWVTLSDDQEVRRKGTRDGERVRREGEHSNDHLGHLTGAMAERLLVTEKRIATPRHASSASMAGVSWMMQMSSVKASVADTHTEGKALGEGLEASGEEG